MTNPTLYSNTGATAAAKNRNGETGETDPLLEVKQNVSVNLEVPFPIDKIAVLNLY